MKRKHIILLIIGLLLISGMFAIRVYNKWHYKKYKANIEHNHDVMKYFVDDSVSFVRTAFAHLETHFASPNDFNLNTYFIRSRDTIVNGTVDTVYSIYFTYFVSNDNQEKLSKLSVYRNNSSLDLFNIDMKDNKEYLGLKERRDKQVNKTMKELKEFIDSLPPERSKDLTDTIKSLFQE